MKKVKVWECKIVVPEDAELPFGFDFSPRSAAIKAITDAGVTVIGCTSGWGGTLTREEEEFFESQSTQAYPDVYFAGLMSRSRSLQPNQAKKTELYAHPNSVLYTSFFVGWDTIILFITGIKTTKAG